MKKSVTFLLILVLLAGGVGIAYWNAPRGDFIWDDINLIVFDYQIKSWNFMSEVFSRDFFGFSDDDKKYGYYRPLVTITYAADWALWENNPAGYHLTNILIHLICTFLVFFIFYRLANRTKIVPTLAALLFAVHPIHTESVTWIAGRTDPLAAMFFFAALWAFLIHAERLAGAKGLPMPPGAAPDAGQRQPWLHLGLSIAFFIMSMLAKEMAVSLPVITTLFLVVYVSGLKNLRRLIWFLPAMVLQTVVIGGYFLFRHWRVGYSQQAKDPFDTITAILSFIKTIGYYTLKTLVPVHLSAYIQNPLVESVLDPAFLAGFALVALLAGVVIWSFKRDKLIAFSLLFYLASLLPLSNLVRISGPKDMGFMTAERFVYIPSAPLLLVMALLLGRLIGRFRGWAADVDWHAGNAIRRLMALVLAATILVSLTALTIDRNRDWYDNETIFTQMIDDAPNATLLYVVLGNIYRLSKKYDQAETVLNKALEYIAPRDREEPTWIYNDLAGIYAEQHRFDEALQLMKLASRTRMHNSAVLYNYGEIYRAMGDCNSAVEYYQRSLKIQRDNRQAFIKMGLCFQQQQRWETSNKAYLAALELTPNSPNLHNQVGYNYLRMANLPKAEMYFKAALDKTPDHEQAVTNLALLRFQQDKKEEAVRLLQEHLRRHENDADAHATLGTILSQISRLKEAGPHIRRALEINPHHVQARLTLASLNLEKHPAKARGILLAIIEDVPGHIESTFAVGRSYVIEGDNEMAIEWFRKVLKRNPRHRDTLRELGALGWSRQKQAGTDDQQEQVTEETTLSSQNN